MSTVELAVKKVSKLSIRQAKELLGWLEAHETKKRQVKRRRTPQMVWRASTVKQRKAKFKAWHDSIRGTTDWEIPRMPDEMADVNRFEL